MSRLATVGDRHWLDCYPLRMLAQDEPPGRWIVYDCGACSARRAYVFVPDAAAAVVVVVHVTAGEWCEYCDAVAERITECITSPDDHRWPER